MINTCVPIYSPYCYSIDSDGCLHCSKFTTEILCFVRPCDSPYLEWQLEWSKNDDVRPQRSLDWRLHFFHTHTSISLFLNLLLLPVRIPCWFRKYCNRAHALDHLLSLARSHSTKIKPIPYCTIWVCWNIKEFEIVVLSITNNKNW